MVQPGQAGMAAALIDHDRVRRSTELPLFFGRKDKDCITARNLVVRLEKASTIANWPDDARRCNEFFMILRDRALIWWEMLEDAGINNADWNAVKVAFLKAYEPKYTAKTTCTNFGDLQQLYSESVHDFSLRLQETFTKLCAAAPATMATVRHALPAAGAGAADLTAAKAEGMKDMQKFFKHQLFLAGLVDTVRPKVMEAGKDDFFDSLDVAREVETINADRKKKEPPLKIHTVKTPDPNVSAMSLDDEELTAVNAIRQKRGQAPMNKGMGFGKGWLGPNYNNAMCRYCKKQGHFQKDCRSRQRDRAPMVDAQGKPYQKRVNAIEGDGESATAERINSVSVENDSYSLNWM